MNIFRTSCIAALTLIASTVALADTAPSVQAPSPQIDTQWALAALEDKLPTSRPTPQSQPVIVASSGNTWTFQELIDGQLVEIEVTEIANAVAKQLAKRAVKSALDLAGL